MVSILYVQENEGAKKGGRLAEIHQPGAELGAHAENPGPFGRTSPARGALTSSPVFIVNNITLQPGGHLGPPVPRA